MAFTIEEERILRLIIDELRTRKKLDAVRTARDSDFREGMVSVNMEVDAEHAENIKTLQTNFNIAEQVIIKEFA